MSTESRFPQSFDPISAIFAATCIVFFREGLTEKVVWTGVSSSVIVICGKGFPQMVKLMYLVMDVLLPLTSSMLVICGKLGGGPQKPGVSETEKN